MKLDDAPHKNDFYTTRPTATRSEPMTEPLWRYEIPVHPDIFRDMLLTMRARSTSNQTQMINNIIDSTHHALAIPMLSEAQQAAKIVKAAEGKPEHDPVNHPRHYTFYKGLEIIDLVEQMNFNRGNAVKYITRAGIKDQAHEVQDLEKAVWYLQREIERLKKSKDEPEKSEA